MSSPMLLEYILGSRSQQFWAIEIVVEPGYCVIMGKVSYLLVGQSLFTTEWRSRVCFNVWKRMVIVISGDRGFGIMRRFGMWIDAFLRAFLVAPTIAIHSDIFQSSWSESKRSWTSSHPPTNRMHVCLLDRTLYEPRASSRPAIFDGRVYLTSPVDSLFWGYFNSFAFASRSPPVSGLLSVPVHIKILLIRLLSKLHIQVTRYMIREIVNKGLARLIIKRKNQNDMFGKVIVPRI